MEEPNGQETKGEEHRNKVKAPGGGNPGFHAPQHPLVEAHAKKQTQRVMVMIKQIPSQGGEERSRGITDPESRQKAHRPRQQEVGNKGRMRDKEGTPKEGQELEDRPARLGGEVRWTGKQEGLNRGPATKLELKGNSSQPSCRKRGRRRLEKIARNKGSRRWEMKEYRGIRQVPPSRARN